MPASAATVLRTVRSLILPEWEAPRVVGVDDWAMCAYSNGSQPGIPTQTSR